MYNLLIALGTSLLTFLGVGFAFSWLAAIFPALIVLLIAGWYLTRRTNEQVQVALAVLEPLMAAGKVKEVATILEGVRERFGRWQFGLSKQVDGQLGMLEYMQMHYDVARPMLLKASEVNWSAAVALGCLALREKTEADAKKYFEQAAKADAKEPLVYLIPAITWARRGRTSDALATASRGLESLPDHSQLKKIKALIANRKPIGHEDLPEAWRMFYPEDAVRDAVMRGRRGPDPYAEQRAALAAASSDLKVGRPRGKLARRR